jgi:hypothetical protein
MAVNITATHVMVVTKFGFVRATNL